jgi:hypothetical protein
MVVTGLSTEGYSTNKSALIEELINYSSTNYEAIQDKMPWQNLSLFS